MGKRGKKKTLGSSTSAEDNGLGSTAVSAPAGMKLAADAVSAHGFLGDAAWPAPDQVRTSEEEARPDFASDMLAHEYLDEAEVLAAKVKLLADLVRRSQACLAYTGAGISTASGISDYASKAAGSLACGGRARLKKVMPMDAQPTFTHRALTVLHSKGHLKHWVQQNHDGLPQKAGYPQRQLNEIHGSLFDPSNPVVPMGGNLKRDVADLLAAWEHRTDLCLAMGTSMVGMSADCVAETVAEKSHKGKDKVFGTVIISVQRTRLDAQSCLRIFAPVDCVMERLAAELDLVIPRALHYAATKPDVMGEAHVYEGLPYNSDGVLDRSANMTLDLRAGSRVRIIGQSEWDRERWGDEGEVVHSLGGLQDEGHYSVRIGDAKTGILRVLGRWWIEDAQKAAVPILPIVTLA